MKFGYVLRVFIFLVISVLMGCTSRSQDLLSTPDVTTGKKVSVWVTRGDQTKLMQKQNDLPIVSSGNKEALVSAIDFTTEFQEIEGFGAALTGSSAYLINRKMTAAQRQSLLKDLFDHESGIGISYIRITMGASDFSLEDFTYDDLPAGQTDEELANFSIAKDRDDLIPVLKLILAIQPNIKIMATPWSAPAWMKSSGKLGGGSLKSEWYDSYASYFLKYLQAYEKEGIHIDAISLQNEPLHEAAYPSMKMEAAAQADFIKNHVGPAMKKAGLATKILAYDHNWDRPDYPLLILNDPLARQYVSGSAFHAYGGNVAAMSQVRAEYPDKGVYFTEISGGRWATNFTDNLKWNMSNIFIGTVNNWSRNALLWNIALDENDGPKNKGCDNCRGVVTVKSGGDVTKNVEYYTIAHMSKFVRPGAHRVQSDKFPASSRLESVAFSNQDGSKVFVVLNRGADTQKFTVRFGEAQFAYSVEGNSVATLVWK